MQLSEAIDGWLAAHAGGLSMSTRRDIIDIGASAERCGYGWMDCVDVRPRHLAEIVGDADAHSSLNATAIEQFLEIAVEWAITQDEPAPSSGTLVEPLLPSDTDGWLDADPSPVVDDLALRDVSWVDELPPVDDLDLDDDGELDDVDEDQYFEVEDIAPTRTVIDSAPEADETLVDHEALDEAEFEELLDDEEDDSAPADEPVDDEQGDDEPADDELVDEDDLDDDELAAIDEDLATTDEDDLGADELDDIDQDLDALIGKGDDLDTTDDRASEPGPDRDGEADDDDGDDFFDADLESPPPTTSAFATAAASGAPADPAASSFLRTLEETGQTPAVFGGLSSVPDAPVDVTRSDQGLSDASRSDTGQGGIFTEAAHYEGERSIDWITVAYFAVAAICFALVIYFYLSS